LFKPLLLVGFFFILFTVLIISNRLELSLEKSSKFKIMEESSSLLEGNIRDNNDDILKEFDSKTDSKKKKIN